MTVRPDTSPLKWGFSTLGCPDLGLAEVCELAALHRLCHLELRMLAGTTDLPGYFHAHFPDLSQARALAADRGLQFSVLGTSAKLVGGGQGDRQELIAFAELAEGLGAPWLRVFGGGRWGDPLTDAALREARDTVLWWRQTRAEHGWNVDLLMETHDAFSATEPCLRLNDLLEEPVPLIWDTHHTWRLGGENPLTTWEALRPFTRHIHVKDSIAVPSARHPYTYVLPGDGEMPLATLLATLADDDYAGHVSLEWELKWHPYLPTLDAALSTARRIGWF